MSVWGDRSISAVFGFLGWKLVWWRRFTTSINNYVGLEDSIPGIPWIHWGDKLYKRRDRPNILGSENGIVLEALGLSLRFARLFMIFVYHSCTFPIGNEKSRKTLMYTNQRRQIRQKEKWSMKFCTGLSESKCTNPCCMTQCLSSSLASNALLWAWYGPGLAKTHGYNHI